MLHVMLYLFCVVAMYFVERDDPNSVKERAEYAILYCLVSGLILFIPLEIIYWVLHLIFVTFLGY